jgi:hypothetical protein
MLPALLPLADRLADFLIVSFVPMADICTHARGRLIEYR